MTETYMRSSGSLEVYENGEQLHDMQYNAESDGNNIDFYKMLVRLTLREVHTDVNVGTRLLECLREIE